MNVQQTVEASLTLKDVLTITVSFGAVAVAVSATILNFFIHAEKRADDGRKAFDDAIFQIQEVRSDFAKLRGELGDSFDNPSAIEGRSVLSTRRIYATMRVLELARSDRFYLSSIDNLQVAASLMTIGRIREAVPFYKNSVDSADNEYDRATGSRVLGRARILSGDYAAGRAQMLAAHNIYQEMAQDRGFDATRMYDECAETYRRLVEASSSTRFHDHLHDDVEAMLMAARRAEPLTRGACLALADRIRVGSSPVEREEANQTVDTLTWRTRVRRRINLLLDRIAPIK